MKRNEGGRAVWGEWAFLAVEHAVRMMGECQGREVKSKCRARWKMKLPSLVESRLGPTQVPCVNFRNSRGGAEEERERRDDERRGKER